MKILIVVDKYGSAIDRLSQEIMRNLSHLDIRILPLHPKRPSAQEIADIQKAFVECDILHIAYWKSGEKLKELVDVNDFNNKLKMLCHYNPYDVHNECNSQYSKIIVGNKTIHEDLPSSILINYGINLDFWKYKNDHKKSGVVNMVVARIEGKKGVLEVGKACYELGLQFVLVGRISDQEYFNKIKEVCPTMIFKENITDEELREVYYNSDLHVCNSQDNFESGTMPVMEAMACGCPVLTRIVGHIPDLYDGQNLMINNNGFEDVENIKKLIEDTLSNDLLLEKMRDKSWETIKNYSSKRMAWRFEKVYYKLIRGDNNQPFVSVVVPTYNRPEVLIECLSRLLIQDYPYFEIVVVDSGDNKADLSNFKSTGNKVPVKYIWFKSNGEYTLAKARNNGVLEASGDLIMLCDERMMVEQGAITAFVANYRPRTWQYGVKDDCEKGFVENLSCVSRDELVYGGMFQETACSMYGAMTQEIRSRFERALSDNPMLFVINTKVRAKSSGKSGRSKRRQDIITSKDKLFKLYGAM